MKKIKAVATATAKTAEKKQSIDLSAIQSKTAETARQRKQTAETQSKTASKQSKTASKQSKTASKTEKQSKTAEKQTTQQTAETQSFSEMKLSQFKKLLQLRDETAVNYLYSKLNTVDFTVELRDTTSCILFVRDSNKNTAFNVYDMFRIQFTTQQVAKYSEKLLADSRFYTFTYKNKTFISAKSQSVDDFFNLCEYCYKVIRDTATQQTATATQQTAETATAK